MNPLCLLTKGRTFKDMAPRLGAYKLLASSTIPKYAAGKRLPVRPSYSAPEPAQKSLFEQPPAPVQATMIEPPKSVVPPVIPPVVPDEPLQPVVSNSPFAPGAKTSEKACARGTWKRITSFCRGLIQRFIFGRKRRSSRGPTIQAELALEKVTVMRNDLNEDDLEVVLVERKVGTGEKPLARVSKMEVTTEVWLKLMAPFRKKNSESASDPKAGTKPSPELIAGV
jgi:hypothetical protein